jgi:hypothetical protein
VFKGFKAQAVQKLVLEKLFSAFKAAPPQFKVAIYTSGKMLAYLPIPKCSVWKE